MFTKIETLSPLPFEMRLEMISSLYAHKTLVLFGFIGVFLCNFICWEASHDPLMLVWMPYFASVTAWRFFHTTKFFERKSKILSVHSVDLYERRFILGSSLMAIGVGTLAAYTLWLDVHPIAPILSMGLVAGILVHAVGRNFASIRNAMFMINLCCTPVIVTTALKGLVLGDNHYIAATVPMVIVQITAIQIAEYLNGLMTQSLRSRREAEAISQRFNLAVTSVPHGLVLVDGSGKMLVVNQRAAKLLSLYNSAGISLRMGLSHKMAEPDAVLESIYSKVDNSSKSFDELLFETVDGRYYRFNVRGLEHGDRLFTDEEWGGKQEGAFVVTILDVSRDMEASRQVQRLARFDGLTELANRRYWEEVSLTAVRQMQKHQKLALAVFNIDRFKLINDTLGHAVGDGVLQSLSERLIGLKDKRLITGRLSGDEFVVLVPGLATEDDVYPLFDRVFSAISGNYIVHGHSIDVRCSGGVIVRDKDSFDIHGDLSRADSALDQAKYSGSKAWMLFDDMMEASYQSNIRIKNDLRKAIINSEIELVYQPIFDITGQRIVSAEALCRWHHSEVGYIPPSQFVAMAEEIGVINKLTDYVMRTACRDCMTWDQDVTVAVNLSALDIARDGVIDMIADALVAADMPASRLCIELTETVFIKDFEKTASTLRTLQSMGVKTSLDDFGTGYSSLSYMRRLPLNRVKIDRSFIISIVDDLKARQLYNAVVGLAKGLGFEVVVEGVESKEQLEQVVVVNGVDMIQGHIFSRGISTDQMKIEVNRVRPDWSNGSVIRLV